jgi:hypothetical protein
MLDDFHFALYKSHMSLHTKSTGDDNGNLIKTTKLVKEKFNINENEKLQIAAGSEE